MQSNGNGLNCESKPEMRDAHCLRRTVNKSFWSFLDHRYIQHAFQVVTVEVVQFGNNSTSKVKTTKFPSNGFMDAFSDLLFDINTGDCDKRVVFGDLLLHLGCDLWFSFCTARDRPGTKTEP